MQPYVSTLAESGLRLVANAALVKDKEFIEAQTGVKLDQAKLSPDDLLKLQKFQMENEEELLKLHMEDNRLGLEETKVYLADVDSARRNMIALQSSAETPKLAKLAQPLLAFLVVALTVVLFFLFVYWSGDNPNPVVDPNTGKLAYVSKINSAQKDIIIYILGVLSAAVTQILGYYFGSSSSSARKSDQLDSFLSRK
jgi:hypothetical protein